MGDMGRKRTRHTNKMSEDRMDSHAEKNTNELSVRFASCIPQLLFLSHLVFARSLTACKAAVTSILLASGSLGHR